MLAVPNLLIGRHVAEQQVIGIVASLCNTCPDASVTLLGGELRAFRHHRVESYPMRWLWHVGIVDENNWPARANRIRAHIEEGSLVVSR